MNWSSYQPIILEVTKETNIYLSSVRVAHFLSTVIRAWVGSWPPCHKPHPFLPPPSRSLYPWTGPPPSGHPWPGPTFQRLISAYLRSDRLRNLFYRLAGVVARAQHYRPLQIAHLIGEQNGRDLNVCNILILECSCACPKAWVVMKTQSNINSS